MTDTELIHYFEHIRFQIVVFDNPSLSLFPNSAGSGFVLIYKGKSFLISADHVVNIHDNGARKINDGRIVAIQTNQIENQTSVLIPIGGFYFFDEFKSVDEKIKNMPLFDATFSILREETVKNIQEKCITSEVKINGANVSYGEQKYFLLESSIITANKEDVYSVFGRVKFKPKKQNGITYLVNQLIFHTGLKYAGEDDNYYILQYSQDVILKDWSGLSGSAVINQNGNLIGIVCSVDISGNRRIWVKKIRTLLPLMDAALLTEAMVNNNKK